MGKTYRISPLKIDLARTIVSSGNVSSITYRLDLGGLGSLCRLAPEVQAWRDCGACRFSNAMDPVPHRCVDGVVNEIIVIGLPAS